MADIFISYYKHDRELVEMLAHDLSSGYTVWWDNSLVSGDEFSDTIRAELDEARLAFVLSTPNAISSNWVRAEAAYALQKKKLAAIRTPDVDPNALPFPFGQQHTVLLSDTAAILGAARHHCGPPKQLEQGREDEATRVWT